MMKFQFIKISTLLSSVLLTACHTHSEPKLTHHWLNHQQLILVLAKDWSANKGILQRYEYKNSEWKNIGTPVNVVLGKNGLAWGGGQKFNSKHGPVKTEGDLRSPVGMFNIGKSFGYADKLYIDYPYKALSKDDYCIDNPKSEYYNEIVNTQKIPMNISLNSTEPMRRDLLLDGDQQYKLGIVLEYNTQKIPQAGSCIFVHLQKSEDSFTAGCTAMKQSDMENILHWLNVKQKPVFVLLPVHVYEQKKKQWNLPIFVQTSTD